MRTSPRASVPTSAISVAPMATRLSGPNDLLPTFTGVLMHPIFSKLSRPLGLVAVVVATAPAAWAHHSFAMFDATQTLTVQGTVKELQWSSPHTWLEVMAKDQTGAEKQLSLELNGISGLR